MIAAIGNWIIGYDNLSGISGDLSDNLAMLATGGGIGMRQLYTDDEEKLFRAKRPIMVNGIPDLVTRPDLADRSITLTLSPIPEARRRTEQELLAAFERVRPQIVGALLDAVANALRNLPHVKQGKMPRMADFANWVVAAAMPDAQGRHLLGFTPDQFLVAYEANREESDVRATESSPVIAAIWELLSGVTSWQGTTQQLLDELNRRTGDDSVGTRLAWPKTATGLATILRRLAPNLRRLGVNFVEPRRKGKNRDRILTLEKTEKKVSVPSALSAPSREGSTDSASSAESDAEANGRGVEP